MSPPVFLLEPELLAVVAPGGRVAVTGPEGHHGAAALRLRSGEPVELVDGAGRRVAGPVAEVGPNTFTVHVEWVTDEPRPDPEITVVQALAKGDRGESAVEMLTEVGADRIVPWAARRCVVQWRGPRADRGQRRWRAVATAAGKQSRRARHPAVEPLASTADVAQLLGVAGLALVLHESAQLRLTHVPTPPNGSVVLVVGPEGGIDDDELRRFEAAGAIAVRLGDSLLRTSTAGVAAASVVMARSGRWG
jgi:16S rRNA (uracil1498-N3)-methyltransferase